MKSKMNVRLLRRIQKHILLHQWPTILRHRYCDAKTPLARARAAAARIELLLKEGK